MGLTLGALFSKGLLPKFGAGPSGALEAHVWPGIRVGVRGQYLPAQRVASPDGSLWLELWALELASAVRLVRGGEFEGWFHLGMAGGQMRPRVEQPADRGIRSIPWWALAPAAEVDWLFAPHSWTRISLGLVIPLGATQLGIVNGPVMAEVWAVAPTAGLGIGSFF